MTKKILAGVNEIGCGYDIYGQYASSDSIKSKLFDWSKAQLSSVDDSINTGTYGNNSDKYIPEQLDAYPADKTQVKQYQGYTLSEYHSQLSASAKISGAEGLFSASVKSSFSKSIDSSSSYAFFSTENVIGFWRLQLTNETKALRALLKTEVKTKLDSAVNPQGYEDIFNTYGSHFLANLIVGGKAVVNQTVQRRTLANKSSFNAEVEASYGVVKGSASLNTSSSSSNESASSTYEGTAVGGDPTKSDKALQTTQNFEQWQKSLKANPTFVGFADETPLLGIWELLEDSNINKAKMHNYFTDTWLPKKEKEHKFPADLVTDIDIKAFDNEYSRGNHNFDIGGFNIISQDLNQGARGEYIYAYQQKNNQVAKGAQVITDLLILVGENVSTPDGYKKISQDLNQGAGGDYIYLCTKAEEYKQENIANVIKDIWVVSGDVEHSPLPEGYQYAGFTWYAVPGSNTSTHTVPVDLNAGAGGKYVYLCYRK